MSRSRHSGRVVVVLGASSGIGRATARACARRGDTVVLASRAEGPLREAERECRMDGAADTLVVPTDVTNRVEVEALVTAAVARFGRIDVWVHTAAVVAYGRLVDQVPGPVFDQVLRTNLEGSANAARAVLPQLRAQGSGTLVLLGSIIGAISAPYLGAYAVSKWGVHGLARILQIENRDVPGVRICTVSPGGVNTPIYRQAANYVGHAGRAPIPVDSPEKVARAVLRAVDRPRRNVSVGLANEVIRFGFSAMPPVYDVLVTPLMKLGGLSKERMSPHEGNVFEPQPALEAVHGPWDRQWLRGVGVGTVAAVAGGAAAAVRRGRGASSSS